MRTTPLNISGPAPQVNALKAFLAANPNWSAPLASRSAPIYPAPANGPISAPPGPGAAVPPCNGSCSNPNAAVNGNTALNDGALATSSNCLTSGQGVRMCADGSFPAYTVQAPFYVTKTPTRKNFDVPCAVAVSYFADVATKCASANSILSSLQIGNPDSLCCGTQVEAVVNGNTAQLTISAPAGCDLYTPGLLFTLGMSNNTSPGPVSISVTATGADGCSIVMDDIRGSLQMLGAGQLALLFGCDEEQRLYPVIGRMRTNVPLLPAGTVIGANPPLATPLYYPNETIVVTVTAPGGTTLTVETLTWNHPTLSCLWNQALGPLGL